MTITDRDRKILLALVPLAILGIYWFLLLAPKREEAAGLQNKLTSAQSERDTAVQQLATLGAARRNFDTDYATVIKLGKSIPTSVDMPSLLVQLDRAARGTHIQFTSIDAGDRTSSDSSSTPQGGSSTNTSSSGGSGSTTPAAGNGSDPAAGGSSALDTIPLDFQFNGTYFDLADFFHRMKRFVHVANNRIIVRGRLMTINSFTFETPTDGFPNLKATVHATVYLAPKKQGVSAGATPNGPAGAGASPGSGGQSTASSSSPTPAATVTAP